MGFRDNNLASYEKEIAHLREELARAKANDSDLEKRLADAELSLEIEKAKGGRVKRFFTEWGIAREKKRVLKSSRRTHQSFNRSFDRAWTFHQFWMATIFMLIIGFIGFSIYRYSTDIQEGVVTSKAYHPPDTTCTTTNGTTNCTTHPESWSVDIAYEGQTASWPVSHREFDRLQRGQWYCYTDLFHHQSDCHGPQD